MKESTTPILAFEVNLNDISQDFITIILGALNTVSELDEFNNDTLRQIENDILIPLIKSLPRIRGQQKYHASLSENANARVELSRTY